MAKDEPACYRVSSLAKRWDCSPGKIRSMIVNGDLACLRLGRMIRIPVAAVQAFETKCQDLMPSAAAAPPTEPPGASISSGMASLRAARIAQKMRRRSGL
jgi:excisionase family DNA binding protein